MAHALARRGIDEILTTGRSEIAKQLEHSIQSISDEQGLGISVVAVRLGRVAPPVAVASAFADADRARSDRRRAVTRPMNIATAADPKPAVRHVRLPMTRPGRSNSSCNPLEARLHGSPAFSARPAKLRHRSVVASSLKRWRSCFQDFNEKSSCLHPNRWISAFSA